MISDSAAYALARESPLVHFATCVQIEDKSHRLITPIPNVLQQRMDEAYRLCCLRGLPIRIIVLKPRQTGGSTFAAHLFYHHARRHHSDGMMMADEFSRTMKIWHIFTEYAARDKFPWDSSFAFDMKKASFRYPDGTVGQWEQETATDTKAGIAGTRQLVWFSEAARYQKHGARTDTKMITSCLQSLPENPDTMVMLESTPEGAAGFFFETFNGATPLAEFRHGAIGNGWVSVFAAWFEFEEYRLPRSAESEKYFSTELDPREKRGVNLYQWTPEQIAWRRKTIETKCGGDERIMDEQYPEDPRSCFLSSGRPRFNDEGMTRLEIIAERDHEKAERGVLESDGENVAFLPRGEDAWLWMIERPIHGCAYIGFCDPGTGEQSAGARYPDAHAAGIIRKAYLDEKNVFHPVEVAAVIDVPNGCRWDVSLLADRLTRLLRLYGDCMVVPEVNKSDAIIIELRRFGARIYEREVFDRLIPGKQTRIAGWYTDLASRNIWVEAIADAIREQTQAFDCRYLPAVREMRGFVIDDRGKAQAAPGLHDDWVTGIGLGLACIRLAITYFDPLKWRPMEARSASAFS